MGITLKQSVPEDKSYQPEDGLAPVKVQCPQMPPSQRCCVLAFLSNYQSILTVVLAVTDVFSQYRSPRGRGAKMVVTLEFFRRKNVAQHVCSNLDRRRRGWGCGTLLLY